MQTLEKQRAVVTGGSRGLGRGGVEALVARGAEVTVVARTAAQLRQLEAATGAAVVAGGAADPGPAGWGLRRVRPTVLVLNAGATPVMAPLDQQSWESFSENWNTDVRASFHWVQAALRLPLEPGSRVLLSSSGAAIGGSPLSGGYAGAKRMVWLMAADADGLAAERGLGIRFQALLLRQINGATALGRNAAEGYARKTGVNLESFLAGFGKSLSPRDYGEQVARLLSEPDGEQGVAFGIHGETGIQPLGV